VGSLGLYQKVDAAFLLLQFGERTLDPAQRAFIVAAGSTRPLTAICAAEMVAVSIHQGE
jgi:hypothetical protein